jgi:MIP family channel proteins
MKQDTRKLVSELVGTFALVFVGAGAVIVESHTGMSHLGKPDGKVGLIGIALAHGFTLSAMVYAFGAISGAHFNPAVSLAVWLRQRLSGKLFGGYIAAQLAGAVVAAGCLAAIFPDEIALAGLGTPALAAKITGLKGVIIETMITFLLVTSVLFATRDNNETGPFAGVAIGLTLVALILFAGPLTGAGANPARYFGPALVSGNLREAAVYFIGPLVGGSVASFAFAFVSAPALGAGLVDTGRARDEDETEASREASNAARERLRQAHELFRTGHGPEAAALLLPVLAHVGRYPRELVDRVRSLLIVIEEEHGPIEVLSDYQALIYARSTQSAH